MVTGHSWEGGTPRVGQPQCRLWAAPSCGSSRTASGTAMLCAERHETKAQSGAGTCCVLIAKPFWNLHKLRGGITGLDTEKILLRLRHRKLFFWCFRQGAVGASFKNKAVLHRKSIRQPTRDLWCAIIGCTCGFMLLVVSLWILFTTDCFSLTQAIW